MATQGARYDGGAYANLTPNPIIDEILPVKESVLTTVIIYRYFMQAAYPNLDILLQPTNETINSFAAQTIAAINGDYQSMEMGSKEEKRKKYGPPLQDILEQFGKLIITMAANMGDPTWKTPWWMPGPLTPVGVLAKKWGVAEGKKTKSPKKLGEEELCDDPEPPAE